MLKNFRRIIDVDPNVQMVLLFRLWTIFAGIITVFAIPHYLTEIQQGYYYTFLSIIALQALFDLGLAQTVIQISSHEFAHIEINSTYIGSENQNIAKLAYLKCTVDRWYRWVGVAFVIFTTLSGVVYFVLFSTGSNMQWLGPWIALVVTTGINLVLSPRLAIVEGAGWTGHVALLRLTQSAIGYAFLVASLVAGAGLWSVVAVPFVANLCSLAWLRWRDNPYEAVPAYLHGLYDHSPWRIEILGLQWRVAIAWLGGYFASQVIVPVVFALQGAGEAGKLGLALQIFTAVQALGMSWISARIPLFGQLIARGDRVALRGQFNRAATSAILVSAIFSTIVVIVLYIARHNNFFLSDRIPSELAIVALAGVSVIGTVIYALAAYMRAHKEEPLVFSSLMIGVVMFIAALLCGRIGTDAVVFAYAGVMALINLPWTIAIFRTYRRRGNLETS